MSKSSMIQRLLLLCTLITLCGSLSACERKPSDVDKWRKAKGGMEKITGWVKDSKQPMPLRERAMVVLVEDDQSIKLPGLLNKIKDESTRQTLADATVPTIMGMWEKQDMPKMTAELKEKGGQVNVKGSQSVRAKDAAYYLYPFISEANKAKFQGVFAAWLGEDQELRKSMGRTTLAQLLPYAGAKGMESMMDYFDKSKDPGVVAVQIKQHADEKTKKAFNARIAKLADAKHPALGEQLMTLVLNTDDPVIVPYLKRAIEDDASSGALVDDAMTNLLRIEGPKASLFLQSLIDKKSGLKRWVAVTRMIELRGKDGVLQGANALPLELTTYNTSAAEGFYKESDIYCNFVKSEYAERVKKAKSDKKKKAYASYTPEIKKLLTSSRWPAQTLGLRCVSKHKLTALKPEVEALSDSKQVVPGWDKEMTVGALAKDVASAL